LGRQPNQQFKSVGGFRDQSKLASSPRTNPTQGIHIQTSQGIHKFSHNRFPTPSLGTSGYKEGESNFDESAYRKFQALKVQQEQKEIDREITKEREARELIEETNENEFIEGYKVFLRHKYQGPDFDKETFNKKKEIKRFEEEQRAKNFVDMSAVKMVQNMRKALLDRVLIDLQA